MFFIVEIVHIRYIGDKIQEVCAIVITDTE